MKKINLLFVIAGLLFSCDNYDHSGKGNDIPTAGDLEVWADHGDSLMLLQMKEVFESRYPKARIKFLFATETEILTAVNDGHCRVCFLHRDFQTEEKERLENRNFKVRSVRFAKSSIAAVVNPLNKVNSLSEAQIKGILSGELNDWNKVGGNGPLTTIVDRVGGSNYLFFYKRFSLSKINQSRGIRAVNKPHAVLEWVSKHSDALGFVSINWLADRGDSSTREYRKKVKVLKIFSDSNSAVYPFQSQMYTGEYPFTEDVYLHDLQGYSGLGSGFAAWICSQPGQVLLKKCGLLPYFDAGRTIEISTE